MSTVHCYEGRMSILLYKKYCYSDCRCKLLYVYKNIVMRVARELLYKNIFFMRVNRIRTRNWNSRGVDSLKCCS